MRAFRRSSWSSLLLLAIACGGGDDDGATDAGPPDAGAQFPGVDEETWTFVPIEGNECMDGSPTGIGVNLVRGSDKLAFVFEGGGACFNVQSCSGVAHQDGYGEAELAAFATGDGASGMFDRTDANNPLRDWSFVFVPYCTGDIHAGSNPSGFGGRRQVGYVNSTNAAQRVAAELGGHLTQVLVAGQSAGGFGAAYNYDQLQGIFADVERVDLLDDSGPPVSSSYLTPCFEEDVDRYWLLDQTTPAGCTACDTGGIGKLVEYYSATYPDDRQGYVSSLQDATIRQFIAFGYPDCDNFVFPMAADVYQAAITELQDEIVAPLTNANMFTLEGEAHVWTVGYALGEVSSSGTTLATWIGQLVDGDAAWDQVTP